MTVERKEERQRPTTDDDGLGLYEESSAVVERNYPMEGWMYFSSCLQHSAANCTAVLNIEARSKLILRCFPKMNVRDLEISERLDLYDLLSLRASQIEASSLL
jgi:hypothetical protein